MYPERIAYLAGYNNYCWVHFRNGEKKLLAKPISYLEGKLPNFIRVHKTTLINPAYIKGVDHPPRTKMAGKVHLDSGEEFIVSRRRWSHVINLLQIHSIQPDSDPDGNHTPGVSRQPQEAQSHPFSAFSIFLITEDAEKAVLTKLIIRKKWPAHQLYTNSKGTHLPDMLKQLPEREYPALILLDAQTKTREQLHTLRHLKEDRLLSRIPVVLLISPTDQLINDGYQQQANSVVPVSIEHELFRQTMERICQFWLTFAMLPGVSC